MNLKRIPPALFLPLFCLFFLSHSVRAQSDGPERHAEIFASLADDEKVNYVIDNHYVLYSADFDNALKLMKEAVVLSRKNKWKEKEALVLTRLGVIEYLKGHYDQALPAYLTAYKILDSLHHHKGLAKLCNEMAVFYRKQRYNTEAYQYLDRAEQFSILASDSAELGTAYGHRATLFERDGKTDSARILYRKVYEIRLAQKDSVGLGYVLLDLASMASSRGNIGEALSLIQQSTAIRKSIGDEQGVAVNLVNTGETYVSVNDFRKAIPYFEECLKLATKVGYTDLVRYTYQQLAQSHVALNDYKRAFLFHQQEKAFNDSLYTLERAKMIADMQTRYETEKKEQQIVVQQARLAEQDAEIAQTYTAIGALIVTVALIVVIFLLNRSRFKRQQQLLIKEKELSVHEAYIVASIQSQENERKRFAQDLHDGMGQLISALRLALLSVNKDSSLEHRVEVVQKAEALLNDMHREIRSIAFNLMPQTLVLHGLVPALREMSDRISTSGQITVRVSSFDVPPRLAEVQEISLFRAIQEWLNNVVKYSGATRIEVQLVGHEREIAITIEDNGNGFDTSVLEQSHGNGWKNIKSRLNLVKGSVEIDSVAGKKGTTLILRLPLQSAGLAIEQVLRTNQDV